MKPALKIVGGAEAELPEAPFPPDEKAKGWRFELDYERIETSDTWALARDEIRPWLLMLWFKAWQQTPIGSLPNNDELIARKIGMDTDMFSGYRHILMRGWRLHDDGRFYHPVIIETAERMLESKHSNRVRQQKFRAKQQIERSSNDQVTDSNGYVTVTDPLLTHQNQNQNQNQDQTPGPEIPTHPPANLGILPSYQGNKDKNLMHGAQKNALHAGRKIPELPLIDKDGIFYPQPEDITLWTETYPAVDVMFELGKMRSWIDANPTKRKTAKGIRKFINGWLGRCQDNGGSHKSAPNGNGAPRDKVAATYERSLANIAAMKAKFREQTQTIEGEYHEVQ